LSHKTGGKTHRRLDDLALFAEVDFARVADAFSVRGIRVESSDVIAPAIRAALAGFGPRVVDAVTDPECNPEPPWAPGSA